MTCQLFQLSAVGLLVCHSILFLSKTMSVKLVPGDNRHLHVCQRFETVAGDPFFFLARRARFLCLVHSLCPSTTVPEIVHQHQTRTKCD